MSGGPFVWRGTWDDFNAEVARRYFGSQAWVEITTGSTEHDQAVAPAQPQPAPEQAAAMAHIVTDPDAHRRHRCPTCAPLADAFEKPAPDLGTAWRLLGEARALLDHETRLTWQSGLAGERARVAGVRESAGLEAL